MAYRLCVFLLAALIMPAGEALAQSASGTPEATSFFSQGQSIYDSNNLAKSRDEALRDLYEQAVTQAIGTLMEPSRMGNSYPVLQGNVLGRSESYILNYQVFSETKEGGVFRIRGQATVAMDALSKDLQQLGLLGPAGREAGPSEAAAVELPVFKQKVLWAVVERWNGKWALPQGEESAGGFFALSVFQESQDYEWSLILPDEGAVQVDGSGSVPASAVISAAQASGARSAVSGIVTLDGGENGSGRLQTTIRVMDVGSGQIQGEIHQEVTGSGASYLEGAMDLAAVVVPQMDRLLRQAPYSTAGAATHTATPVSVSIGDASSLRMVVHSYGRYVNWEEIEKALRNSSSFLRVKALEIGPGELTVYLEGVDPQLPGHLQGIRLSSGLQVQVRSYSRESNTLEVALVPGIAPSTEWHNDGD